MKQTSQEKLTARLTASREIVRTLLLTAKNEYGVNRRELTALALRLASCADPRNNFIAVDAHNSETGDAYDAIGTLWNCGSKLCPTCLARQSRKNRQKLRNALDRQQLSRGERYSFVTFTIPNPRLSLAATREIVDRAWCLFRKRRLCVDLIKGGAKSEEFTLSANGYHYHLHFIWRHNFMLYNEVRRVWTECISKAFEEAGQPLEIKTSDGYAIIKFMPMKDREKAIQEVCKYITKSDSWVKMKQQDLTEIALIRRWFRMFELFGTFANREAKEPTNARANASSATIVHTRSLTDGGFEPSQTYWRDFVLEKGIKAYREHLSSEIASTWQCRTIQLTKRWPAATIKTAAELGEAYAKFNLTPKRVDEMLEFTGAVPTES